VSDIEFSHGSVNRREWKYCEKHRRVVTEKGSPTSCAATVCSGKTRVAHEFCFTYTRDGVTRRARGQAPTRAEALDAMEVRKAELSREPEPEVAAPITFNDYADKWLETIKSSVEPNTVSNYLRMLKNHARPTLGALALGAVTRGQIKDLLATKREAGLSKNSVRLLRAAISAMYSDAIDAELVTANPAARTGRVKGRKAPDTVTATERRAKIRAMSVEQLQVFLQAAATNSHPELWLTLADAGLRPGEAFALHWDDVDLAGRTFHIHRAVARGGRIKSTKTGETRYVDLTPRLAAALDALQTKVEAEALAAGRDVNPLVFPNENGKPMDDINVARRFRALLVRAGLPKFRLYDLRHTFGTHLLSMNAPITYVAAQLGHSKPTTTLLHYAHWIPRGDRALADKLEALRTQAQAPAKKGARA
jgi:integrase